MSSTNFYMSSSVGDKQYQCNKQNIKSIETSFHSWEKQIEMEEKQEKEKTMKKV